MCATLVRARNWFGGSCTGDPVRFDQWWHGVPMRQGRQHFRMVRKDYCRWFEKITVGGGNRIARSARRAPQTGRKITAPRNASASLSAEDSLSRTVKSCPKCPNGMNEPGILIDYSEFFRKEVSRR
jgi:hypothetical protein